MRLRPPERGPNAALDVAFREFDCLALLAVECAVIRRQVPSAAIRLAKRTKLCRAEARLRSEPLRVHLWAPGSHGSHYGSRDLVVQIAEGRCPPPDRPRTGGPDYGRGSSRPRPAAPAARRDQRPATGRRARAGRADPSKHNREFTVAVIRENERRSAFCFTRHLFR
jgi:hypothetical protein